MTPNERLRQLREHAGLDGPKATAARFGFNVNTYTSHENGNRPISRMAAERYGAAFQVPAGYILFGESGPDPKPEDIFTPVPIPGEQLVGAIDLPVFAAAQGGDGHIIVTFDPIDYVKRPEPLKNVKGGYGLLITGTSMVPAYRPGDIALMHPHLPPARDTEVALFHTPPNGEAEAIIKTLTGFNDREWTLQQYNPSRTFTEFRKEWPICHRSVGKYNAR